MPTTEDSGLKPAVNEMILVVMLSKQWQKYEGFNLG
jgi:hypothetical protein